MMSKKDIEVNGCGIFKILSKHLPDKTEKTHEILSQVTGVQPRIKPSTS
jgi:hypothetical protein